MLECLERHGVAVVSSCRAGVCQSCAMRAVAGEVPAAAQAGLKPSRKAQGYFLSCQCPVSDDLEVVPSSEMRTATARIAEAVERPRGILRVRLELFDDFPFRAGQYVQLVRADGLSRAYSIANLPGEGFLELHVAVLSGGKMSEWLRGAVGQTLEVRGPQGDCFYMNEPDEPLLLAGTGTGLSPLLGVLRAALRAGHRAPICFIHGARSVELLYERHLLDELSRQHANVRVLYSVLSPAAAAAPPPPPPPPPPQDLDGIFEDPIDQVVARQSVDTRTSRIYLCGSPDIVAKLKKKIYIAGASLDRIHSDPFSAAADAST